jgi:hypothetical protein
LSPDSAFLLQDQILPRLQSAIPNAVSFIGSEDAHELVQDGTALAAKMMHNAEKKGKKVTRAATGRRREISAGNIAYFTITKLRNGCRSTGFVTGDVYGSGAQIQGRARLTSLDDVAASDDETGGEIFELHDVLADGQDDPATKATRKMDWETFIAGLSGREVLAIEYMVDGKTLRRAIVVRTKWFGRCPRRTAKLYGWHALVQVFPSKCRKERKGHHAHRRPAGSMARAAKCRGGNS